MHLHLLGDLLLFIVQFSPVLALYDPFGVDVPLNLDITHSLTGRLLHVNSCIIQNMQHDHFKNTQEGLLLHTAR